MDKNLKIIIAIIAFIAIALVLEVNMTGHTTAIDTTDGNWFTRFISWGGEDSQIPDNQGTSGTDDDLVETTTSGCDLCDKCYIEFMPVLRCEDSLSMKSLEDVGFVVASAGSWRCTTDEECGSAHSFWARCVGGKCTYVFN